MYDYLVVGAGLFGAVYAHEMTKLGKRCLVIDRRSHIGGNCYTEIIDGITVHTYGPHIFHTSDKMIWDYIGKLAELNGFVNSPIAIFGDEVYNLPFNMNTFSKMWGVKTPEEASAKIAEQVAAAGISKPKNLEEQALALVGADIYEKLIKGYTQKQWGRSCTQLPPSIIKRLPVRFTYDNNYFTDRWQGIPVGGYTPIFEKLLAGIEVCLDTDILAVRDQVQAKKIVYTGAVDEYFDYRFGSLDYRSLRFETKILDIPNYQGNAVVNYTSEDVPYTRIVEHKHFEYGTQPKTVITCEYPARWSRGEEPYYPVNDVKNLALYERYKALAEEEGLVLGGRLGEFRYLDMDKVIRSALNAFRAEFNS